MLLGLVLFAVSILSGCSWTNHSQRFVTVTVKPADATVIANGVEYNHGSPMVIEVCPSHQLFLTAYKPGYQTA